MASNGLHSDEYCEWIDSNISIDERIQNIIENFVIGTPAEGLSHKGRSLYSYYHLQSEHDYSHLYYEMIADLSDTFFAETYDQLKEKLESHSWLGFKSFPTDVTEAIYVYVGKYSDDDLYKAYFSHLPKIESKGLTNEQRKSMAEPREMIARVDKIFYHLRNSIAHGSYGIWEGEETFFIFQDESKNHSISARIILTEKRLLKWIELLQNRSTMVVKDDCIENEEAV